MATLAYSCARNADTEGFEVVPKFRCKIVKKYSGIKRKCKSLCMATPSRSCACNSDTEGFEVELKFLCKIVKKYSGIKRKCKSLCMDALAHSVSLYPFSSHGGTKNWRPRFFAMKLSIVYNILAFSVPRWAPTASAFSGSRRTLALRQTARGPSTDGQRLFRDRVARWRFTDGQRPFQERRNRRRRFLCCVRSPEASPVAAGRRLPEAPPPTASAFSGSRRTLALHRRPAAFLGTPQPPEAFSVLRQTAGGLSSCRRSQTARGLSADGQRPMQVAGTAGGPSTDGQRLFRFASHAGASPTVSGLFRNAATAGGVFCVASDRRRPLQLPQVADRQRPVRRRPAAPAGSRTIAGGVIRIVADRRLFHGRDTARNDRIFRSEY